MNSVKGGNFIANVSSLGQRIFRQVVPDRYPINPVRENTNSFSLATWNVKTLYQCGKLENVRREMRRLKINILGLSEVRWTSCGRLIEEGEQMIYSGGSKHENGVAILLDKETSKSLLGFCQISERVIMLKLKGKPFNMNVIQCYAPTAQSTEADIEEFYSDLDTAKNLCKSQEVNFVMGDLNAKVGKERNGDTVGPHGLGEKNQRGQQWIEWCENNNMMI